MTQRVENSLIAEQIQQVIDLFGDQLAQVAFPDVTHQTLTQAAAAVQAAGEEQKRAEEKLALARQSLRQAQEALYEHAQRGLAYAKIYANGHDDLIEEVKKISLGPGCRGERHRATTKRRKKKGAKEPKSDDQPSLLASTNTETNQAGDIEVQAA